MSERETTTAGENEGRRTPHLAVWLLGHHGSEGDEQAEDRILAIEAAQDEALEQNAKASYEKRRDDDSRDEPICLLP